MSIPHRNHSSASGARRPDQNHKSTGEKAGRDESPFPVIATFVRGRCMHFSKNQRRIGEIKAAVCQRCRALIRIECDARGLT
jgi:hypothetical protein